MLRRSAKNPTPRGKIAPSPCKLLEFRVSILPRVEAGQYRMAIWPVNLPKAKIRREGLFLFVGPSFLHGIQDRDNPHSADSSVERRHAGCFYFGPSDQIAIDKVEL